MIYFQAGNFQFFDYGHTENQKRYGQPIPPQYNMEKIDTPIALFYAQNDWLAGPEVWVNYFLWENYLKTNLYYLIFTGCFIIVW